jgi:hypothetical protein
MSSDDHHGTSRWVRSQDVPEGDHGNGGEACAQEATVAKVPAANPVEGV